MNWFDEQIKHNHNAGIEAGIVFFFNRKSPNSKTLAEKAVHGDTMDIEVLKVLNRYPDIREIYEQYDFVDWAPGSIVLFPILTKKQEYKG